MKKEEKTILQECLRFFDGYDDTWEISTYKMELKRALKRLRAEKRTTLIPIFQTCLRYFDGKEDWNWDQEKFVTELREIAKGEA
jgi:hypothetical protein